ncbi:MAG: hypothetical protein R2703_04985 [Micropruina glycogenica]
MVDSREQRRLGVTDSLDLARSDWFGSIAEEAGARVINGDHVALRRGCAAGTVWHNHGIRILPGRRRCGWTPGTGYRPPATRASTRSDLGRTSTPTGTPRIRGRSRTGRANTLHSRVSGWRSTTPPARQVLVEPDLISATLKAGHQCPYSVTVRAGM